MTISDSGYTKGRITRGGHPVWTAEERQLAKELVHAAAKQRQIVMARSWMRLKLTPEERRNRDNGYKIMKRKERRRAKYEN